MPGRLISPHSMRTYQIHYKGIYHSCIRSCCFFSFYITVDCYSTVSHFWVRTVLNYFKSFFHVSLICVREVLNKGYHSDVKCLSLFCILHTICSKSPKFRPSLAQSPSRAGLRPFDSVTEKQVWDSSPNTRVQPQSGSGPLWHLDGGLSAEAKAFILSQMKDENWSWADYKV